MKFSSFTLLFFLLLNTMLDGQQITVSPWTMHRGTEGIIDLKLSEHGDPIAYDHVQIPELTDDGWQEAPLKDGKVHFSENSKIGKWNTPECKNKVDFTYFQTIVTIPEGATVNTFNVSYDQADDGARIYLFNETYSKFFDPNADLKYGQTPKTGTVNFANKIVPGKNRVVIAQFDDCGGGNLVSGINIKVNGTIVIPEKITVSPWEMHRGTEGIIDLKLAEYGDPIAYNHMNMPNPDDSGWKEAPLKDGKVNFSEKSKIGKGNTPECKNKVDYTYFQTTVTIADRVKVETFNVSYDKADDGARIYFFNKNHNKYFDPNADLKYGKTSKTGTVNFANKVAPGQNRVVIVQFDSCGGGNNVIGINIEVNGKKIKAI